MFNTFLVKGDINQVKQVKDSLTKNDLKEGEIGFTNFMGEQNIIGSGNDFKMGGDYFIARFMTINDYPKKEMKILSLKYPDLFFLLTVSSVYDLNCYTSIGFNGSVADIAIPVIQLDDDRNPVYYDESDGYWKYLNCDEISESFNGSRCFRNPFTMLLDALIEGKYKW